MSDEKGRAHLLIFFMASVQVFHRRNEKIQIYFYLLIIKNNAWTVTVKSYLETPVNLKKQQKPTKQTNKKKTLNKDPDLILQDPAKVSGDFVSRHLTIKVN